MSVQFRVPKDAKWLYPQNQAFADDKVAGKKAEPFHWKEVVNDLKSLDFFFLTPQWVMFYGGAGFLMLAAAVGILLWTFWAFNDPDMSAMLNPFLPGNRFRDNWLFGAIFGFVFALAAGFGMSRWAWKAYPYLKYPTPLERQYRQLLDKGYLRIGQFESLVTVDEKFVQVIFSMKNGRVRGKYLTISPVAKSLKKGDKLVVLGDKDFAILL